MNTFLIFFYNIDLTLNADIHNNIKITFAEHSYEYIVVSLTNICHEYHSEILMKHSSYFYYKYS